MTQSGISRRTFLVAGGSVAALTACQPGGPSKITGDGPSPAATVVATARQLLEAERFFVAHRGSGDNWPEHTLTAYRESLAAGAAAVEISVCATADGVLVCHHDVSALRVLGVDRPISELTWEELSGLSVDARRWLGPLTPLEPVSRLDDVLRSLGPDALAFVEDKQGTNTSALLAMLDAQPRSTERFVWKQWAGASQVRAAKERGYLAWGFLDADMLDRLDEFAATFDILGIPVATPDADIATVVAAGLPVMSWEVHFHDDVDRLTTLGVTGMMCSNIGYLVRGRSTSADDFGSGRRAAGDLPSEFDRLGWGAQPALVPDRSALRIEKPGAASYLMGSIVDPSAPAPAVDATVRWPEAVPPRGSIGVVVALTGDAPGGDGERGFASGYEVSLEAEGEIRLSARDGGTGAGVLASAAVAPPVAGQTMAIRVELDPDRVRVMLDDVQVIEAVDGRWRGPWIRLFKDYETAQAVEFSGVAAAS